jgi:N-acetylglucosamine-6-phosphate deacetylase
MDLLIRNATVLTPGGFQPDTDVCIEAGLIDRVGSGMARGGAEVLDARGLTVAPGFIDIHVHGAAGAMCEEGAAESLERISRELARFGVTGFLATLATLSPDDLRAAVDSIARTAGSLSGARVLGIHLEGPYLSPARAGAQAVPHMRAPSLEEFDELQARCAGMIRLVTIAPELPGALSFIAAVRQRGVIVSIGHSNATAEETMLGVEAGATHVTHLFNAMRAVHHREPGVIGVALTDDTVSVELICDGHHVSPRMVDLTFRCKPIGRTVLVSDAVAALGLPDGPYAMFGVECVIRDGAVRLRANGALAGSCLCLDQAVRNVHRWLPRLPLNQILEAASSAPAAAIGERRTGVIAEGGVADLVVLDAGLTVVATVCGGQTVWRR